MGDRYDHPPRGDKIVNTTDSRGPHHADDTDGHNVILVEFVAKMVPHDSPDFQERQRVVANRPVPDYLKSETNSNPSADSSK